MIVFLFFRKKVLTNLFCSYSISSLFKQFGLVIKHNKSEVFYFSGSSKTFNPPPLDLKPLEGSILNHKDTWQYLEFFFNRKLFFQHHFNYYTNKALSIIKCMKMLKNSTKRLLSIYKYLLYRTCVLPITSYGL